MIDHRSNIYNSSSFEVKACKKFRPGRDGLFFSGFNFSTAQVAMINQALISSSAIQIYDLSHIHLYSSSSVGKL